MALTVPFLTAVGAGQEQVHSLGLYKCGFTNMLWVVGRGSQDGLAEESFPGLEMGELAKGSRH